MKGKKILIYVYLMLSSLLCFSEPAAGEKKVRVNIVGYTRLSDFLIYLNLESLLVIDGVRVDSRIVHIFTKDRYALIGGGKRYDFTEINIRSPYEVEFDSIHGTQKYRGDFSITSRDGGIRIVNEVGLDDYLASVLGSEMGDAFSDETLKAQAIAIRTYFLKRRQKYRSQSYDIHNADGIDMVYRGSEFATKRMYRIMAETKNLVLVTKEGDLALPLFHSTSGGIILIDSVLSSGFYDPPANPVATLDRDTTGRDLASISPYYSFECYFDSPTLIKILSRKMRLNGVDSIRLKYFSGTTCVDFIGFVDRAGDTHWLKAYKFISLAQKAGYHNLRSIQFTVQPEGSVFYFTGKGFGHLCGMSQYSAEKMARDGADYKSILKKYYPSYKLKRL